MGVNTYNSILGICKLLAITHKKYDTAKRATKVGESRF